MATVATGALGQLGSVDAQASSPLAIVTGGVPRATVVIAPDADEQTRHAADEVIRYVDEATGATLPLATLDRANPVAGNQILVGVLTAGSGVTQQEVAALGQDGYIIRRAWDDLTIVGRDGWGNRYGVYEFCERYLDVRWLMPDELVPGQVGRDVPSSTDVTVSNADITESPAYIERMLHPLPPALTRKFMDWDWESDNAPWLTSQGRSWGDYARLRHAVDYVHNLYRVISPSKYGDPNKLATYHPEFFPIHDGQYDVPAPNRRSGWQPRFSAPGIAAAAANEVLTYLRANPDARSYSLAVNDGYGYSDDDIDPDGVTNVLGYRTYSEAYYAFVNDVAALVSQEFPDVLITVLAYRRVERPPSFNLHPNVFPLICRDTYMWVRDDVRNRDRPWVDRWAQISKRFGLWDYVWGAPYCIPRMYLGELGRTISDLHAKGCVAAMAQADEPWGEGPKPWVLSKLYQDPDQSVSRLTHEWCCRVAGHRAAPHLWAYFRLWERLWTERIPQSEWFNLSKRAVYANRLDAGYLEVITETDIDEARHHLLRAADLTATQEQANRVEVMATWFAYYEASALSYPKRRPIPGSADEAITTIDDAAAVLDRNIGLAHDRLQMGDLFHQGQPRGNDHPQRYGLVWSGWDLYAAWAVAEYIKIHEPAAGPVREHAAQLRESSGSQNVQQLATWALGLADGEVITRARTSFDDGTLGGWSVLNGQVEIVDDAAHTGTRSLRSRSYIGAAITRNIEVQPGFYRFEAYVHVPADSPYPGYFALLRTDLLDAAGKRIQRLQKWFAFDDAVGGWHQIAFTEVLDCGVTTATCAIHFYHTDAYVDSISITQLASAAGSWQRVVDETFDDATAGEPPAGWTATIPGTIAVEEAGEHGRALVARATAPDQRVLGAMRHFGSTACDVRFSCQVRYAAGLNSLRTRLEEASSRRAILGVTMSNGTFSYLDGDHWVNTHLPYTPGVWYEVACTLHVSTGRYDVYIDGTEVGSAARSPGAGAPGKLWFAGGGLEPGQESLAVDNVVIETVQ